MPWVVRFRAVPLGRPGSPLPAGEPTAAEAQRAAAIAEPRAAHEFLAGRLALRAFLAGELGVDPVRVRPAYRCPACGSGEHGAPGFSLVADDGGPDVPLRVAASMSRAGGWALLALDVRGAEPALGVDLVFVADFRRAIPDAAYSERERRRLLAARDAPTEAARLWARKEALLKAHGTGLRTDPASVETLGDPCVTDLDAGQLGLPDGYAAAAYAAAACAGTD